MRAAVLLAALGLSSIAVLVGLDADKAPGTSPVPSPIARPTSTPTPTMPALPTPTAIPSATPAPVGIVARRIRIDRLGIDLQIIEGDGVDAPLRKAAHYPSTGWPDGGTNIYIYGHAQAGMFLALWDASVGDEVVLELVDGTTRQYVVTVVKRKVPWDALEYLAPTPTEQLTLQTSTSYTATAPRFIVIAEPAP